MDKYVVTVSALTGSVDKCLRIVEGTDMISVRIQIKDFSMPEGASALVYAKARGATTKIQVATINGNAIEFTPEKGIFTEGENVMQGRITKDGKDLVTFAIVVICTKSIVTDDAEETSSDPTLLQQLLDEIGVLNQGGLVLKEKFISQQIDDWLTGHPGTMTITEGWEQGSYSISSGDSVSATRYIKNKVDVRGYNTAIITVPGISSVDETAVDGAVYLLGYTAGVYAGYQLFTNYDSDDPIDCEVDISAYDSIALSVRFGQNAEVASVITPEYGVDFGVIIKNKLSELFESFKKSLADLTSDFTNTDKNAIKNISSPSETLVQMNYPDMQDLPVNSFIYAKPSWFTGTGGLPLTSACYIHTLGAPSKGYFYQIVFCPTTGEVCYRYYNTSSESMTDWVYQHKKPVGNYIAFGDSITYGQTADGGVADTPYPIAVAKALNMQATNMGLKGSGFLNTTYHPRALETVQATDLSGADLITIALGRNDVAYPLGTADNESGAETICGQLKAILDHIKSVRPIAQIVIIAPTRASRGWDVSAGDGGWSINEYIDTAKTICDDYCVPVIGWQKCSLFSNWLDFAADKVHPTSSEVYDVMGAYIAGQIMQYYAPRD